MLEALELGIGLEIVQWFQTIRSGLIDALALLFHASNDGLFYVAVIGAIYWMYNKRLGVRMLLALIMISAITLIFKDLLGRPRPYDILDSGIIPLLTERTSGIPSGHAAMPLVVWGYVAYWMQRRWLTTGVIFYVLLMGIFRIYAGVHFPQDVIAGWLLGGVVLWGYIVIVEQVISWWKSQNILTQIGLPVVIGLLLMLFFMGNVDVLTLAGLLMGVGIAVVIESRWVQFTHREHYGYRIVQFVFGITIALVVLEGLDVVFDSIEPPTYAYVEGRSEDVTALQAQVATDSETATDVCTYAVEQDVDATLTDVCVEQVTPLAAILRVLRYGLLAFVTMSVVPYLSIRLNLMQHTADETATGSDE